MRGIVEFVLNADPVALYGAVTGTFALLFGAVAAFNNFFDRPWLRVRASIRVDKRNPDKRYVTVTVLNVGRRKASCYMPTLRVADRRLKLFCNVEPDQIWEDGHGWAQNEAKGSGYPEDSMTIAEYDSEGYEFLLEKDHDPLWVTVTNMLGRQRRGVLGGGRIKYPIYALIFRIWPYKRHKPPAAVV